MPKVSVVMAAYNEAKHIEESVNSILRQTFDDFELIIIDDGSTDETIDILTSYSDRRLRVFCQKHQGQAGAWNKGIQLATGEYIARMDADDIAFPDRLKKQVAFLDQNPNIGFLGTCCSVMDARTGDQWPWNVPASDKEIRKTVIKNNPFAHSSMLIRKKVFEDVGLYSHESNYFDDYEMWVRAIQKFKAANLPDTLMLIRKHGSSVTNRVKSSYNQQRDINTKLMALRELKYPAYYAIYLMKPVVKFTLYRLREGFARR